MKGYVGNIEEATKGNDNFRKVLYTAKFSQLVVMNLMPNEEIGEETHTLDQFIRIESGKGKAVLDGVESEIADNFAIVVPAGTKHNFINTSPDAPMKLYTIYSPPEHRDGVVHATKEDAMNDKNDEFEGKTTE
jgi:mannose-6-phosphate isomerase-like protein (cupin superfamily)